MGSALPESIDGSGEETVSRTIVNPAVQGIEQVSVPGDYREVDAADTSGGGARKLPWIGIGAGVLALSAVAAAVAWMWAELATPQESVAVPVVKPVAPAIAMAAAKPEPIAAQVAPQPAAAASQGALVPVPTARSLSVSRRSADGRAVPAAVQAGERIELQLVTSHDAHVYCYLQDENKRIVRFYPNRFQGSSLVKANTPLSLPGGMRFEIIANAHKLPETVACFASGRDIGRELPATAIGSDFAALPVGSLDELRQAFARADATSLAESRFAIEFK
jgi:hypothetical protein